MYSIDKNILNAKAVESGFNRDNLEKVFRLIDVLFFIHESPILSDALVLKGGTAINLTIFKLPRLSVDIDLDFNRDCTRQEMLTVREDVRQVLSRYMAASGYFQDLRKSKQVFSLDSWVFYYRNAAGNLDNIKVEINYSMRIHVLPVKSVDIALDFMDSKFTVNSLSPEELFGSKIKALIERCAPRDLYDVHNMIQSGIDSDINMEMLRKCVLFYRTVGGTGAFQAAITQTSMDALTYSKIRQTLLPVLRKSERIDLEEMKCEVSQFLEGLLIMTVNEKTYLREFNEGRYRPELLFDDSDVLRRIQNHPMAIWKTKRKNLAG